MTSVVLLKGDKISHTKHPMFVTQLEDWFQEQGHQLTEVFIDHYNNEIHDADIIILAIPVEQIEYQAFKQFLQSLPKDSFTGKKVFSFVLGGTVAHVSIMELYLQPLLTRLGVNETIKPISIQSNRKSKRKNQVVNIEKMYEFFKMHIPQVV
ncbi:hypothetical protein [Alkalicoccobacillus porphyridii]|uniref:NAD(P)H-dependent oxidoreductase n=1 Tax=Alkalicoccobacillus porphyridii TaxID=2597270 RepID=A0A554A016_9BACI|nr:hypothetical protein [Alkalicoccobacillus porphyridii]TSB47023.1 hypothetical protein FN960_08370 [Alkalicoccobacillus porphyridii]